MFNWNRFDGRWQFGPLASSVTTAAGLDRAEE
jgi:hypothetical protein